MSELIPFGSVVKPYGQVEGVTFTGGERYYFLVGDEKAVALMPAALIEKLYKEQNNDHPRE